MRIGSREKSTARDMTRGPILQQLVFFALPLMLGNVFQMLYNTVDSIIVGNFVSKQALAAIGSTTVIVNMLVFFFAGFAVGAGVVIGQNFGAKNLDRLHDAVHTTMAATFVLSLLLTAMGVATVRPMLVRPAYLQHGKRYPARGGGFDAAAVFSDPDERTEHRTGSVLCARAEYGHCRRRHCDDYVAVCISDSDTSAADADEGHLRSGVEGTAHRLADPEEDLRRRHAGCAAVGNHTGAGDEQRSHRGTITAILMTCSVTGAIAAVLAIWAPGAVRLFSPDAEVIRWGAMFIRVNVFVLLFNCVNHVLAGALRGRGDSRGPMIIMLSTFVVLRQIYLYVVTHFVANTPALVGFGYPVGWMSCCIIEVFYARIRLRRHTDKMLAEKMSGLAD